MRIMPGFKYQFTFLPIGFVCEDDRIGFLSTARGDTIGHILF